MDSTTGTYICPVCKEQVPVGMRCSRCNAGLPPSKTDYAALSEENRRLRGENGRLQAEKRDLLSAVKMAYRKHWLDDDSIGWEELGEHLQSVLTAVMGDEEFVKFLEGNRTRRTVDQKDRELLQDRDRLDWLQEMMRLDNQYCEIYLAGLRDFTGEAKGYQVESNPEVFSVQHGKTLREAIDKARRKEG